MHVPERLDPLEAGIVSIRHELPLKVIEWDLRCLRSNQYIYGLHFFHSMEAGLKRIFLKFLSDQSGATAIEYGLIAAGIALAIIAAVNGIGTNLNTAFSSINTSLK
jgi:pilus assembly protein Flp/PilA